MSARTAIAAACVPTFAAVGAVVVAIPGAAAQSELASVRQATAAHYDLSAGTADGFGELQD